MSHWGCRTGCALPPVAAAVPHSHPQHPRPPPPLRCPPPDPHHYNICRPPCRYDFDTPRVNFMRQMLRAERSAALKAPCNSVALKRLAPTLQPLPERPTMMAFGSGDSNAFNAPKPGFNVPQRRPFGRVHLPAIESAVPSPAPQCLRQETTTALAYRPSVLAVPPEVNLPTLPHPAHTPTMTPDTPLPFAGLALLRCVETVWEASRPPE